MSKNEINENLLSNYVEAHQEKKKYLKALRVNKEAGKTLEDFYTEVQAQKRAHGIENIYYAKTADEIEIIMMSNRKRIEANYTKR
jgi:hypothetical protein